MARYRIEGELINLPEGTTYVEIVGRSSSEGYGLGTFDDNDGSFVLNIDYAEPDDLCWVTITAENQETVDIETLSIKTVGPYLISEVGVVAP